MSVVEQSSKRNPPLDKIQILDLTMAMSGPFCTQLLGDLGADVIKIESPGKGDLLRSYGPPFFGTENYYFMLNNRNKRSMTLNLHDSRGVEILMQLAANADVLIENFRPSVKTKLGIDHDNIKPINPKLIYASISGFGQKGPNAERAGFDQIAQGMSGLSSVTGSDDTAPMRTGVAIGDTVAALFTAYGILAALMEREHSGQGQRVETSLLDALIATLGFQAGKHFESEERPSPQGNHHAKVAPYGTYRTKDSHLNIAAGSQVMWERLAKVLHREDLIQDSRFATIGNRVHNRTDLTEILESELSKKTTQEWESLLDDAGVAVGPILHIDEVFQNAQVLHNEMILEMSHPMVPRLKTLGFPTKLSETPATLRKPPPLLGEHTNEILTELGYSTTEVENLQKQGVL